MKLRHLALVSLIGLSCVPLSGCNDELVEISIADFIKNKNSISTAYSEGERSLTTAKITGKNNVGGQPIPINEDATWNDAGHYWNGGSEVRLSSYTIFSVGYEKLEENTETQGSGNRVAKSGVTVKCYKSKSQIKLNILCDNREELYKYIYLWDMNGDILESTEYFKDKTASQGAGEITENLTFTVAYSN